MIGDFRLATIDDLRLARRAALSAIINSRQSSITNQQ
jgi:hypothetical protein